MQNNFKKRVQKNCFPHIKAIMNSTNMIDVLSKVHEAKADVFKTRNWGIFIVKAEDRAAEVAKFERRHQLTEQHEAKLAAVLAGYIPERLFKTKMYTSFISITAGRFEPVNPLEYE